MNQRKEILSYIENISLIILGILFLCLPILFTSLTTDLFVFPKQVLIAATVIVTMILFGVKTLLEGRVRLRITPFDLPVFLFTVVLFASSFFAVNRLDALSTFIPVLFAILAYFLIINIVRDENSLLFILAAFVAGATLSSLVTIFSFFHLYILPFAYTKAQSFNTFGSLLDQALYLAFVLPIAGYFAFPLVRGLFGRRQAKNNDPFSPFESAASEAEKSATMKAVLFLIGFIILTFGLAITIYQLITTQKPVLLPLEIGFQTAFAAISQDTGRVLKSFLLGSGFGTFITDFTRFKQQTYNIHPALWSVTFFRSSNFLLELLATTGLLGILSFLFLAYRILKERSFFLPLMFALVAAFLFPFSYTIVALFLLLLGIFASARAQQHPRRYSDLILQFNAMRYPFFNNDQTNSAKSALLSTIFFFAITASMLLLSFFVGRYIFSDLLFQKSLVARSQNNGGLTYQLQRDAIKIYPYRDAYYRIFSQTNLALANSLATAQPKNASPSADIQNNVLTLIQQSIDSGRTATSLAPQTVLNWNNLSSVYRALIGFGQNADRFALLTNQQAISLDSTNPQQFINLGGIYYQLGLWDDAARQFQYAITLKPDYANAYYNLGHTLESKGDLQNALTLYNQVRQLVTNDPESLSKINQEIGVLQGKISQGSVQAPSSQSETNPLQVNQPENQLPERNPKVEIPGPTLTPIPTRKPSPTPSPINTTSPTPAR